MTWLGILRDRYSVATNPLRTERKIELCALLLGLVLCFQLMYSGVRYVQAPVFDAVAPAEDALTVKQIHSPARVSATQSDQIRARPLFWGSRRPVDPVVVTDKGSGSQVKDAKLKDVTLLGVFGADETAGIIVKIKDKKRRIMLGEEVAGWTLESVQPNAIVLSDGGRTETLQLKERNDFSAAPPAAGGPERPKAPPVGGSSGQPRASAAKKIAKESAEDSLSLGGMLGK